MSANTVLIRSHYKSNEIEETLHKKRLSLRVENS